MNIDGTAKLSTLTLVEIAEEGLGSNLQWISDIFDLQIRQKDKETLERLQKLNDAWIAIVALQTRAKMGVI